MVRIMRISIAIIIIFIFILMWILNMGLHELLRPRRIIIVVVGPSTRIGRRSTYGQFEDEDVHADEVHEDADECHKENLSCVHAEIVGKMSMKVHV
jgi:hypothetical protein